MYVRYLLDGPEFYVVVEGGCRFVYKPLECRVQPATFGLNVGDAVLVQVGVGGGVGHLHGAPGTV